MEYRNKQQNVTKYWIGIKNINPYKKLLIVDGLNVATSEMKELNLYYDSIIDANLIEGSFCKINSKLLEDIEEHSSRYSFIFNNVTNLKLLDYYSECNKLDNTPYRNDYKLIDELDVDVIGEGDYNLSNEQFEHLVKVYNYNAKNKNQNKMPRSVSLCMNICSIHTKKGLYVLAYKKLLFDVKNRTLMQDDEVSVCREFTVDGVKISAHWFLDADEFQLLDKFEENAELIKDLITKNNSEYNGVDDMPYVMALSRDFTINLDKEYDAILKMYEDNTVTYPIKAFFGDLTAKPRRIKNYPLALYNDKVNLDQLLAIHNGLKYPVLYVQGPPGSGKTNTILNTVVTAFFNNKSVLISSYNNHPVDEIYQKLSHLKYKGNDIPFPIIRLGNGKKLKEAIKQMRHLFEITASMKVFDSSLNRKKNDEEHKTKALSDLLRKYEEKLDMNERKEMIRTMISSSNNLTFLMDLQGEQLAKVNSALKKIGEITEDDIKPLITQDRLELLKYLNFTSAKFVKRLSEPKYEELTDIIFTKDLNEAAKQLNQYLSNDENFQKFLKIFPIVATTNISAHRLGEPKQYFDMVIMDEASQCNTAVALVPIIRGEQLLLVGDPQQLKPVILLDEKNNLVLKKRYNITDEYDYKNKSVYQTFLSADAVSDEVLLSYHYRCHPKIIEFNNKKYYNNKLNVQSSDKEKQPLEFIECHSKDTTLKNTSESEAKEIVHYVKTHPDKTIAVITPFVNQRNKIQEELNQNGITNVDCGTVHAFQGDEKQEIIFSLALTDKTHEKTYSWLKNNKELINVATSRAKEKLVIAGDKDQLNRLHHPGDDDDLFELCNYVRLNGKTTVTERVPESRALGIKPYSTETETAFLETLNHAINAMMITKSKYVVKKEVPISQVFNSSNQVNDLFYTGRFDYIVYEREGKELLPIFAIELDGNEHTNDTKVIERDKKKQQICDEHNFQLIRVPNNYARRYNYAKEILSSFFGNSRR
ncbi:AAA domain-containing protein [Eubacterium coprostanoligenes]|uniref:AAA domain-containing protein n=1 Tax=Eubacterium coprostanoligenes TaxID=290054 RepID=UPI002356FD86|nr:AAA domain-containing protein [Eubacterium coprostanoligenes]MCI6354546.1 AAA domain-containing protein [Eubacterium coprostanoligenes]